MKRLSQRATKGFSWPIFTLLSLNGITILGNALTEVAIPWLILEISDSPGLVAAVMSAKILPIILSTFFSAPLVDRFGGFRTSIISDFVNFLSVLLIPLFYRLDMLNFALLAVLLALSTLLDSPGRLAKDVLLMKEITKGNYDKSFINGLNTSIENVCDLAGPLIAAIIVASLGTITALYFDAASFLVVAFTLILLKKYQSLDHVITSQEKADQQEVVHLSWRYFKYGLTYIRSLNQVSAVLFISAIVNIVITPFLLVYLPFMNKLVFDSVINFGLSMACFGAGTTASSLAYSFFGKHIKAKNIILVGYLCLTLTLASIPFIQNQILILIPLFFIGLSIGFAGPIEVTLIQTQVAESFFARTMTLFTSIRFLSVPLGYLCFGTLLESGLALYTPIFMSATVFVGLAIFYFWLEKGQPNRH
ncbi:hypothetical protein OA92_11615 [Marinomonas sp. SBI22]|uniref:MFS transporter n=1 Tax=unclassified Marinomonas TaxID=196814 RepID=UPI0007AF96AE|nr:MULTISPECIES: MFS transporter [unclassified Marinomonas]KZM42548.1 hypothetical protein OA92_11615 [Marinomonas sp. SBI22]KZM43942.1 hypothetical protein OA91_11040 [Marinomonas sp. SBI8L]